MNVTLTHIHTNTLKAMVTTTVAIRDNVRYVPHSIIFRNKAGDGGGGGGRYSNGRAYTQSQKDAYGHHYGDKETMHIT